MLSKFIQQLRKKHNFSQEFLASKIGVSRPTYMQIEHGERDLTITEAKKLADIFDISLEDFLHKKEAKKMIVKIGERKKSTNARRKVGEGAQRVGGGVSFARCRVRLLLLLLLLRLLK